MAIKKQVHYKAQLTGKNLFVSEVDIDANAGAVSVNIPGLSQAQCAFWMVTENTVSNGVETQGSGLPTVTLTNGTNKIGLPGTANVINRILALA